MTINQYKVILQSFLFQKTFLVTATSEDSAILIAMGFEEFAPRRCFTAKFIKTIHSSEA